jgi:hypothetical protein
MSLEDSTVTLAPYFKVSSRRAHRRRDASPKLLAQI